MSPSRSIVRRSAFPFTLLPSPAQFMFAFVFASVRSFGYDGQGTPTLNARAGV